MQQSVFFAGRSSFRSFAQPSLCKPFRGHGHLAAVRCLSYKNGKDEKSWGEIAGEVGQVARDLAGKVGSSISKAVGKIIPVGKKEDARVLRREDEVPRLSRQDDAALGRAFGGGLLGNLMGKAMGSAMGAIGAQLKAANEQAAEVQDRAVSMVRSDMRIRDRLGGSVQCGPPMSQTSMTRSINGRTSKEIALTLPVMGSNGRVAQAQVRFLEGEGQDNMQVSVRMPEGDVVKVTGSGDAGGKTIDVDWKEV